MRTNKELLIQLSDLFEQFEKAGIDTEMFYAIDIVEEKLELNCDRDVMINNHDKFLNIGFKDSRSWEEHGDMYRDNIEIFLGQWTNNSIIEGVK